MHPKLRQLQQMQDRRRMQWQTPKRSRLTEAAAAAAGVYMDSVKLLLGALAVALLCLLLTAAYHRIVRVSAPSQRRAEVATPAPHMNLTSARSALTFARMSARKSSANYPHSSLLGVTAETKNVFLTSSRSRELTTGRWARLPRQMPANSGREMRDLNVTEQQLLHRKKRAYQESVLFINNKGGYGDTKQYSKTSFDGGMGSSLLMHLCNSARARCFGYYWRDRVLVPDESFLRQCEFSNNYRHSVPVMLRQEFRAKSLEGYRLFLNALPSLINCIVDYYSRKCESSWTFTPHSNYPAGHNDNIVLTLYELFNRDVFYAPDNQRGLVIKMLMSQCPMGSYWLNVRTPYYRNPAANAYLTVIVHYARCLIGQHHYCADPCQNPMACSKDNMFSNCYAVDWPYKEDNKYQRLIDRFFDRFKPVFNRVPYCLCRKGFRYDFETEECEIIPYKCSNKDDCLNNGKCEGVPAHIQMVIGRSYNCECPPAWQGLRCEEARDPCLDPENRGSCGEFHCRRSPTDQIHGFVCICSSGYTLTRQQGRPSCRDINECAISAPCRNGGVCRNLMGSFECICRRSFSGSLCEIPPPEPFWLPWGPWTACSVSCSVGLQHRRRSCSSEGSCIGSQKDFKNCQGQHVDCTLVSLGHISPEELAGGAGWREEEDQILDDAWYFREFQLLRLGLNKRDMAEDELVSGWEDLLHLYIHYVALAGVTLGIVQFLFCRRIRVRVGECANDG